MTPDALAWLVSRSMADHLWQSTLVVCSVWLLARLCRSNRAAVRHALWCVASLKFLVPLAPLAALGQQWSWDVTVMQAGHVVERLDTIGRPLSQTPAGEIATATAAGADIAMAAATVLPWLWLTGTLTVLAWWFVGWRSALRLARTARIVTTGREHAILMRLPAASRFIPLLGLSAVTLDPGVFGIRRPLVIWPASLSTRLTDAEMTAVLSHEVSHVCRRDNLLSAVHMLVQALFWFHPVTWWIGRRLMEERERACDEDVLGQGMNATVYARAILKTCEHGIRPEAFCLAGVTGANLKTRIEGIMRPVPTEQLSLVRRIVLGAVAAGVVATPVGIGMLHAGPAQVPAPDRPTATFAAASVRENNGGAGQAAIRFPPGRFVATNAPLRPLVAAAYGFPPFRVTGGPEWMVSARFDIQATTGAADAKPGPPTPEVFAMLRSLLEDRFALQARTVTEDQPLYRLVPASGPGSLGPRLRRSTLDCEALRAARGTQAASAPEPDQMPGDCGVWSSPARYSAGSTTLAQLAGVLSNRVSRFVVDDTGLSGSYDLDLQYSPDPLTQPNPVGGPSVRTSGGDLPSIFTALEEQLGLKLKSGRGPVPMLRIDHVERPVAP